MRSYQLLQCLQRISYSSHPFQAGYLHHAQMVIKMQKRSQSKPKEQPGLLHYQRKTILTHYLDLILMTQMIVKMETTFLLSNCAYPSTQKNHDDALAGYPGVVKTLSRLAQRYHWPGILKKAANYVRNCKVSLKLISFINL